MKLWVGVTDTNWFNNLARLSKEKPLDEVNFWQPSGRGSFRILQPGEPFLFKLRHPINKIVGGGFFVYWTRLPMSLAWEAFREKNGAFSYDEMRRLILRRRNEPLTSKEDFNIGCIILAQPFFFSEEKWIDVPQDWSPSIQQGKHYLIEQEPGKSLWQKVKLRLELDKHYRRQENQWVVTGEGERRIAEGPRYGEGILIKPRLGQGTFRVLVTDAYQRACAITFEHSLPALEAAHIKPFSLGGTHEIRNGLLLRSDLHRLFDKGYLTITPDYYIEVSRRLKEDFANGHTYYPLHGQRLHHLPPNPADHPDKNLLIWHNEEVYKG